MTKIDYNIPSFYSLWVVIMKKAFKFTILCLAISSIVACSRNEPVATEKVSDEQRPPEAVRLQPVTSPNGSTQTPSTQLVEVDDGQKNQEKATITASDDTDDADDNDDDRNTQPAVAKPVQSNDNVVAAAPARANSAPSVNKSQSSSSSNQSSTKSSSSNSSSQNSTASNTPRKTENKVSESKTSVTRTNNTTTTITTTPVKADNRLGPAATSNQTAQNSNKSTSQSQLGPAANKATTATSSNKATATADKVSTDKKADSSNSKSNLGPAAQQRTQQASSTEKTEKTEKPAVQKTNTTVSAKSSALMDDVRPINNENRQHETEIGSSKSE